MQPEINRLLTESVENEEKGKITEALQNARQALEIACQAEWSETFPLIHIRLAKYLSRLGMYTEAQQSAQTALDLEPAEGLKAEALTLLGIIAGETNHLDQAEQYFRMSADLFRRIGDLVSLGYTQHCLATIIYLARGQFQLALATMQEANNLKQSNGQLDWGLPFLRAFIYQIIGDRTRVRQALDEMLSVVTPGTRVACGYYILWAREAMDEGELERSGEYLHLAFRIATLTGVPDINVWVRTDYSRFYRLYGEAPIALTWANDAVQYARFVGDNYLLGSALIEHAQANWEIGNSVEAQADLQQVIETVRGTGNAYELAQASFFIAAWKNQENAPDAIQVWIEAANQILRGGYVFIIERERSLAFPLIAKHVRSSVPEARAAAEKLLQKLSEVLPTPLKINGLGQFSVWQARKRIPDQAWKRRKAGELFRYLLLRPNYSAAHEEIYEDLWPDSEPETLPDLLHQATSTLRHILEPDLPDKFPSRYLKVEGERVFLVLPTGSTVDFEIFENEIPVAVEMGKIETLQKALSRFTDEMFPMDRYNDWSANRRQALDELFLRGLISLARNYLQIRQYYKALECIRRVLKKDSWNEDAVWIGMQAYINLNQAPQAIRLYQELEHTLAKDLKLSPRSDLRSLVDQILKR